MGKISEKNKCYRTKQEMLSDLVYILNSPVKYGTKRVLLDNVLWVWTEFYGKYEGCQYWSDEALKLYREKMKEKDFKCDKWLRHEHIVPRKLIIEKIFNLELVNEKTIEETFEKFVIGVVITKQQDEQLNKEGYRQKMPKEFFEKDSRYFENQWLRYNKLNLVIKKVEWEGKKISNEKSIFI